MPHLGIQSCESSNTICFSFAKPNLMAEFLLVDSAGAVWADCELVHALPAPLTPCLCFERSTPTQKLQARWPAGRCTPRATVMHSMSQQTTRQPSLCAAYRITLTPTQGATESRPRAADSKSKSSQMGSAGFLLLAKLCLPLLAFILLLLLLLLLPTLRDSGQQRQTPSRALSQVG